MPHCGGQSPAGILHHADVLANAGTRVLGPPAGAPGAAVRCRREHMQDRMLPATGCAALVGLLGGEVESAPQGGSPTMGGGRGNIRFILYFLYPLWWRRQPRTQAIGGGARRDGGLHTSNSALTRRDGGRAYRRGCRRRLPG